MNKYLRQQLYSHLPPISQTIQLRQASHSEQIRMNSKVTFSNSLLNMDTLVLNDQQKKLTFINSVQTLDAIYRTYQKSWLIGMDSKREWKEFMPLACHDVDILIAINHYPNYSIIYLDYKNYQSILQNNLYKGLAFLSYCYYIYSYCSIYWQSDYWRAIQT